MKLTVLNDKSDGLVEEQVSDIDASINNLYADGSEFRLVRCADHDTIYLSSHTGCSLGCNFCWLTTTGQTKMVALTEEQMRARAARLLGRAQPKRVNFAFMARGEPLLSKHVNGSSVRALLNEAAIHCQGQYARVTVSSIFPRAMGPDICDTLISRFGTYQPTIYWSLYSTDQEFKDKWMSEAQDVEHVASELKKWQDITFQQVTIHHALMKDKNDSWWNLDSITSMLKRSGLSYRVNLIRYNPPDDKSSEASEAHYQTHAAEYAEYGAPVKIQPRVGFDVSASCGMFLDTKAMDKKEKVD